MEEAVKRKKYRKALQGINKYIKIKAKIVDGKLGEENLSEVGVLGGIMRGDR